MGQMAGDVNADSLVDLGDVLYEVSYLYKNGPPPVFYECGDPNTDCVVDLGDILYLISYLYKRGPDPQIVECGWSEPVNLGTPINTDKDDLSISFSSDWEKLALASNRIGTHGNEDIWYSLWDSATGSWTELQNCGTNVNTVIRDLDPCISPDGRKIYYLAWERPGGYGGWDIWVTTWDSIAGEWGLPENLGPNVNSESTEWSPFISFDSSKLYFHSGRYPGGIFVSEWSGSEWSAPVWLGPNVNMYLNEEDPTVTADGNVLYFVRWIEEEGDVLQRIWVSYWSGTEWGPSFLLPPSINYPGVRASKPWITPDGLKLYFTARSRPGGMGRYDIWVSEKVPIQKGKRFINREYDARHKR